MPVTQASAEERTNLLAYLARLGGVSAGPASPIATIPHAEVDRVLKPQPGEWPNYNGVPGANRHSTLDQINTKNAGRLQLQWSYSFTYPGLEMRPLVSDGVMFVTGPNQVCAIDLRSGREIWCYSRPRNAAGKISGDAAKEQIAVLRSWVTVSFFLATDNAHLICLNRITGGLMCEVVMPKNYPSSHFGATGAPLVAEGLVIAGVGGADEGIGVLSLRMMRATGKEAWRFWTVPKPDEPGSETWNGNAIHKRRLDLGDGLL